MGSSPLNSDRRILRPQGLGMPSTTGSQRRIEMVRGREISLSQGRGYKRVSSRGLPRHRGSTGIARRTRAWKMRNVDACCSVWSTITSSTRQKKKGTYASCLAQGNGPRAPTGVWSTAQFGQEHLDRVQVCRCKAIAESNAS